MAVAITTGHIQPQGPFVPAIESPALPILNKVIFPGTTQAGRGVLSDLDRLPAPPKPISGPTTYTRAATTSRVGGKYPVRVGNLT